MDMCKTLGSHYCRLFPEALTMKTNAASQSPRSRRLVFGFAALLLFPLMWGCGSDQLPTYPVSGTVQFEDGTHPMFGDIEFYNADHKVNARGKINRDGSFSVGTFTDNDGAIEGRHQIITLQIVSDHLTARRSHSIEHDHGALINPSFFDYRTSGLECDIVPGDNQVKLTVRKNPRQTSDGMPKK